MDFDLRSRIRHRFISKLLPILHLLGYLTIVSFCVVKCCSEMNEDSSISHWLRELEQGDAAAMQHLWEAFFDRLVQVADEQLKIASTNLVEGEDIAASVFESLWRGALQGRFNRVTNVDELVWLLLAMTKRKCIDQARRSQAQRRGGKQSPRSLHSDPNGQFLDIVSQTPDPQYVTTLNDEFERVLEILDDRILKQITVLRVEGYSAVEIAVRLDVAESTVRRKLKIIRRVCEHELTQS
jgi:RNA polymerase sigma factor (sigma-70 family)